MELLNLLALPDPARTVGRMVQRGVLPVVLPEVDANGVVALTNATVEETRQGVTPDPLRRLAALLPPDPRLAEQVAARLRLSAAQKKRLVTAADRAGDLGDARALAYRLGREEAIDRLLLAGADVSPLSGWAIPELPLKGGEIVARGVSAGPQVARILQNVESRWVAEGFPDRARVEELLAGELP
jgi:poly(A) polymerase